MDLQASVQYVKGVGPQRAESLAALGVRTVEDLLFHLPLRYEDRRQFARIADLRPGMRVSVAGRIVAAGLRRTRRMALYEIRLEDDSGRRLKALWFNQPFLRDVLPKDARVVLYGLVEPDAYGGTLAMASPQYEVFEDEDAPGLHTGRVVPIYEKLGPLSGKVLRRILTQLAPEIPADLEDPLPPEIRARLGVSGRGAALREVHVPAPDADVLVLNRARSAGHVRLVLEEFFLFQIGLAARRREIRGERKGIAFEVTSRTREAVKKILPFRLTGAQKRVLREIADDMQSPHPMNRLVQGDVGAGKTMVALLSMVLAVENGCQAAFMAPTEILAEQHFLTFRRLLAKCPYRVELLSAARKGNDKKGALARLVSRWAPTPSSRSVSSSTGSASRWSTSSTASASSSAKTCGAKATTWTCS
jgi:ATP-dependent DNA helicase RecG